MMLPNARSLKGLIWKIGVRTSPFLVVILMGALVPGRTEAAAISAPGTGSRPSNAPILATEPCQLPATSAVNLAGANIGGPVFGQGGPAFAGSAQLVINCLRMDRSHYPADAMWQAEVVVTNMGNANSGPISVYGNLCRFLANNANSFACSTSVWSLGVHDNLAPGESVLLQSNSFGFSLQLDPPGQYPSWIPGLPDNGTVYLRASVTTMAPGQYVVTQAIYPSAPENNLVPGLVDNDQDGWSPDGDPADCDDNNPDAHPGAFEVVLDGLDNDCEGGDVAGGCPDGYYGLIFGVTDICGIPGTNSFPDLWDLDGDGFTGFEGDCDDNNAFINPFAPELNDSIDNNCNGLVDETFAVPDWIIETYDVQRVMGDYTLPNGTLIHVPGLSYEVEIGNVGDYIGDDFSILQAVEHRAIWPVQPVAYGTSGFIPFTQLPSSQEYSCAEMPLTAVIAQTGLYGEVNVSNNIEQAWIPFVSADYLSLHFDGMPELPVDGGNDTLSIDPNLGLSGSCPEIPSMPGGPIQFIQIHYLLIGLNKVWFNNTVVGTSDLPTVPLPEAISPGNLFCLKVVLDPNHLVVDNPNDNMYALVFEYHDPLFGPPRFDVVEQVSGPPAGIDFNTDECEVSSVGSSLIGQSPGPSIPYFAIIVLGIGGGILGGLGGWISGASIRLRTVLILIGLLCGGVVGGLSPALRDAGNLASQPISLEGIGQAASGLPYCEDLSRTVSTWPADGMTIDPLDPTPLTWEASFSEGQMIPDQVTFRVTSPAGEEVLLMGQMVSEDGTTRRYQTSRSLGEELYLAGVNPLDTPGGFNWLVVIASIFPEGGDLAVPICGGLKSFAFQVGDQPTSTPTATPTDAGAQITPASPTSTPTSIPPTRTPKPTSPLPTRTPIPKNTPTSTLYIP